LRIPIGWEAGNAGDFCVVIYGHCRAVLPAGRIPRKRAEVLKAVRLTPEVAVNWAGSVVESGSDHFAEAIYAVSRYVAEIGDRIVLRLCKTSKKCQRARKQDCSARDYT
jgi:hypothetical protein